MSQLPKLLRKIDRVIVAGYTRDEYRRDVLHLVMRWCVNDKRNPGKNLSSSQKKRNRKQSSVRARVEHVFSVIKQQFVFHKTRYWGLEENASADQLADGTGKSLYAQAAADGNMR